MMLMTLSGEVRYVGTTNLIRLSANLKQGAGNGYYEQLTERQRLIIDELAITF
jgi:hypothetical protein